MPLYEYRCPNCGEQVEVLVRAGGAAETPTCPACGAPMERQWAPVAAHTRGVSGGCSAPRGGFT